MTDEEKNQLFIKNENIIYKVIKDFGLYNKQKEYYDVALIGFAKALNSFDKNKNVKLSTYIYNCIHNEICIQLRNESTKDKMKYKLISIDKEICKDITLNDYLPDEKVNIENEIIFKEENQRIYNAILKLKPEYQKIILKRFGIGFKKMEYQQIGKEYGMSKQAIYDKYQRALKKLKKILEESYEEK